MELFNILFTLLLILIGMLITAALFFSPLIISLMTWNFWHMLLFTISWIPTLGSGMITIFVCTSYAEIFID